MKKTNSSMKSGTKPTRSGGFARYESATQALLKALGKQANRPMSTMSPREAHELVALATRVKRNRPTVTAKPQGDQAGVLLFAADLGARVGEVMRLKTSDALLDRVVIPRSGIK
jgi:integrase